ncbi:hypothetical protein ACRAWG_10230 [Methylobacterium sp. P31]
MNADMRHLVEATKTVLYRHQLADHEAYALVSAVLEAIRNQPSDALLAALHPDPDQWDWQRAFLERLTDYLVRG